MEKYQLDRLLKNLLSDYLVFAPIKHKGMVFVGEIDSVKQINYSGEIPLNTYKKVFLPPTEELQQINDEKVSISKDRQDKVVAFGMNILDLQAHTLFDLVFSKDVYYQRRKRNTVVIGFSNGIENDFRKYKAFHSKYEEDVLEHLIFDIFIEKQKNANLIFFSGSQKGQQLLEKNKIKDYQHIEFAGAIPEEGINPRIIENREAVELSEKHPIWDELAEICLACGKCTVHCPTCFCFDQKDEVDSQGTKKIRQWTSCYYPEFSKVAGGHKDLDTVKKKIYYWYYHKFVRIPDEFSYYGCVSCGRCSRVCPVEINISKVLQSLNKQQ
ncbi:4Fe-4S dicluster domain-containing protein [Candidatus Falkowbacteria bacterium]|jgi:sulfhydrogenase subunit beta (sulfur reductase)|nr:4Fe-4S dicluster domain-containing protein [Candidatus Falkowbacteria bacterium]MBT7007179.1 4Fe-4S dicluster domain-containing protein [Candidatus Falkowbacteria bacterium]